MFLDARQQSLAQHSAALQARSAVLRQGLAQHSQGLHATLGMADKVWAGWLWLKIHPQWLGVGVAVLVVWRPRRAWRLGLRAWSAWRLWRRLQRWRAALPGPITGWR